MPSTNRIMLALGAAACVTLVAHAQQREFVPVTNDMLRNPPAEDWLSWRRTQGLWGYSPLDQINRRNVSQLRLVWARPLGVGVQEGTPLVRVRACPR